MPREIELDIPAAAEEREARRITGGYSEPPRKEEGVSEEAAHTYLGDSVYVRFNPETVLVELYTDNGIEKTNTIFLETAVLNAFLEWIMEMKLSEGSS